MLSNKGLSHVFRSVRPPSSLEAAIGQRVIAIVTPVRTRSPTYSYNDCRKRYVWKKKYVARIQVALAPSSSFAATGVASIAMMLANRQHIGHAWKRHD